MAYHDDDADEAAMENGKEDLSEEQRFASVEVPSWGGQLTVRSLAVSTALGFVFTFIVMKLNMTTGIIPSLNVAAGLLGYFLVQTWTSVMTKFGFQSKPFTRQENTVIQTCVVAASGIAFSSGFGSYVLGMTGRVADQSDQGNTPDNIKELKLSWMIPFTLIVSFIGLFSIVPLRKIMILDYKLTYPSGTATASLINSFHTTTGNKLAKKQVRTLFKWFGVSFAWAFFQWFFTASEDCGFASFPTFGLQAYALRFYFDFSSTYVGVGMICPYDINLSMLFGSVVSWGIMWPLIIKKKGDWYPANLSENSLRSVQGYRVFIAIAMILGDGLYHFVVVLTKTVYTFTKAYLEKKSRKEKSSINPVQGDADSDSDVYNYDDDRRSQFFLKDQIPLTWACAGYLVLVVLSTIVIPILFHQVRWYQVLLIYIISPILAFCNSYGCGLTDWSLASSYGKLAILLIGAWIGSSGGVIAGLAACGVMMSIVSTASDLMQDFKTGYLTLASPRSMFFSQIFGTLIGCIISPLVFWFFFYKAYPTLGTPGSSYPAPYGLVYRGIALIGVEGTSGLPKHCLTLSVGFFFLSIALNMLREILKHYEVRAHRFVPSAMAMAIPFYVGGYFTIDMCVGSLIKFLWERNDRLSADAFVPALASGLICGDSLWGIPSAMLALFKVKPPLCMKFLSRAVNAKVDAFLQGP